MRSFVWRSPKGEANKEARFFARSAVQQSGPRSLRADCWTRLGVASALAVGAFAAGCDSEEPAAPAEEECTPDPSYEPALDPASFAAAVDNPLFPLVPGTRWVYEGGGERIEVTVTTETKQILGITATVVRDTASVGGEVIEDTFDWFAQDAAGNVWYLGEDTKEYEGGQVVSTEGSWEAGVDGAQPGIVMHATQPPAGQEYRQEYYACEAEDMAEVVSTSEAVTVPAGSFTGCLQTREFTPLEPDANEHKYYCPGVGLVLEVDIASGARIELTEVTP